MPVKYVVLFFVCMILLAPGSGWAKRVYFSSDGTPLNDTSARPTTVSTTKAETESLSFSEKMARDAAIAAAAGYALGQTVKVENGIIYKLARDPQTKAYTFKRYRRVIRTRPAPSEPVMSRESRSPDADAETIKREAQLRKTQRREAIAAEGAREKAAADELAQRVAEQTRLKQQEQARLEQEGRVRQAELDARAREEQERFRQAERQAHIDAEQQAMEKAEAETLERGLHTDKTIRMARRTLEAGRLSLGVEHSFLNRKTMLKSRTVTTASGTVSSRDGVGAKDVFYTDVHGDMLKIRYGLVRRLEIFAEAGIVYEQLDEIADMETAWAAGFRTAVFEHRLGRSVDMVLDLTGRYYEGKVSGCFTDPYGYTYKKVSEYNEIEAGIEAGFTVFKLTVYSGLSYALYTEDTVKQQILTPPNITVLDDRLEEQDNLIFKAGAAYRLFPALVVYLEGNAFFREGLVAGMEYRF